MELSSSTVGTLAVLALLVGAVACVLAAAALNGQRRVKRAYRTFSMGHREDVLSLLERHINEVRDLRGDVSELHRTAEMLREIDRGAISRVGVVRYDAFEDLGGRLSFSLALLDERDDGVVVSAINGRTDTRVYSKPIGGGTSRHNLSQEEVAAIEQARSRAGRVRSRKGRPAPRGEQRAVETT